MGAAGLSRCLAGKADGEINASQEHFNTQLSMDGLAQQVGMSPRNFTRRFNQATRETPLSYYKLRIICAKQLLEANYKSVQEVCFAVGYEDIPFFRTVFKRYTGMSPKEYKQRFGMRCLE